MSKRIFRAIEPEWGSNEPFMVIPRVVKVHSEGVFGYEYNKVILQPVKVEIVEDKKVSLKVMTQEEKQLLLKDLCARLPYGVKVCYRISDEDNPIIETLSGHMLDYFNENRIVEVKPYLRSMSSMTEEEEKETEDFGFGYYDEGIYEKEDGERIIFGNKTFQLIPTIETYDWLKSHHFDYRGLIPMGLALPAHEDMYNIK